MVGFAEVRIKSKFLDINILNPSVLSLSAEYWAVITMGSRLWGNLCRVFAEIARRHVMSLS